MPEFDQQLQTALGSAYRLERELGGGGMSRVFLAEETQLARKVVVKVLPPELSAGVSAERFRREIQLAASLQHPHIVPLLAAGQSGELFWYTMPFIEGESLRVKLAREGELPVGVVTRLLRDVTDALAYAHDRGIVHRDIKPDNVLITGGHAVVTDFGVAKALSAATGPASLTSIGVALGTPSYMAPEQAAADPHTDHRADLYAVGALGYEMLSGNPPFSGSPQAVLAAHVTQVPTPITSHRASVPPALAVLVMRCLEKKPADRFQSAREVATQLDAMATPSGGTAPIQAATVPAPAARWRWRKAVVRVVALLVVLGGLGGVLLFAKKRPRIIEQAAKIAVMPFAPTTSDTALARLGRDLVVTLTANLEGVGDIQTVDALSVLAQAHERTLSLSEGAEIARKLNAKSFVHGSLIRTGNAVRLDLGLFTTDSSSVIARASVTASPEDVTALTDSTTWALLRQVWRTRQPPTPNLAAVTTRSIPALRAFLEGEQSIARSEWVGAYQAFERAIGADSTFWLAYYRYSYARGWIFLPVDSTIRAKIREHRAEFPERDRLLAEGKRREVTQRFPDYWPGWMALGDNLVHYAAMAGEDPVEALPALERTISLNPGFMPAYEHLLWAAAAALDSARAASAQDDLTRLGYHPAEYGWDAALYSRYVTSLATHAGAVNPILADSLARDIASASTALSGLAAVTIGAIGFLPAQVDLNRRITRYREASPAGRLAAQVEPLLLAGRGGWDSALVAQDRAVSSEPGPVPSLSAYALSLAGAALGMLPIEQAMFRRPSDERMSPATSESKEQLVWLDGFAGWLKKDPSALGAARKAAHDPVFKATLGTLEMASSSGSVRAADSLRAVGLRGLPPPMRMLLRYFAGEWYLAAGDTAQAIAMYRAPFGLDANIEIGGGSYLTSPYSAYRLATITTAQGNREAARRYWRQLLARYDLPPPQHKEWIAQARAALAP